VNYFEVGDSSASGSWPHSNDGCRRGQWLLRCQSGFSAGAGVVSLSLFMYSCDDVLSYVNDISCDFCLPVAIFRSATTCDSLNNSGCGCAVVDCR